MWILPQILRVAPCHLVCRFRLLTQPIRCDPPLSFLRLSTTSFGVRMSRLALNSHRALCT
jgi:hypothetical protein